MAQATACLGWANDGNWHHLLISVSSRTLRLVIDNKLVGVTTLVGQPVDDATAMPLVTVGVRAPGTYWYRGQIDFARVYYRAVTYEA